MVVVVRVQQLPSLFTAAAIRTTTTICCCCLPC
jgi:hypothetical protein